MVDPLFRPWTLSVERLQQKVLDEDLAALARIREEPDPLFETVPDHRLDTHASSGPAVRRDSIPYTFLVHPSPLLLPDPCTATVRQGAPWVPAGNLGGAET